MNLRQREGQGSVQGPVGGGHTREGNPGLARRGIRFGEGKNLEREKEDQDREEAL